MNENAQTFERGLTTDQRRERAYQDVRMYMANDWEIKEETPTHFLLTRRKQSVGVHVLLFIFTFWFTFGLGNLIYFFTSRKYKKIVK